METKIALRTRNPILKFCWLKAAEPMKGDREVTKVVFVFSVDMWLPILVIETMHWTIVELNSIVLAASVCCGAACLFLIWKQLSNRLMYFMTLFSVFNLASLQIVFSARIKRLKERSHNLHSTSEFGRKNIGAQ